MILPLILSTIELGVKLAPVVAQAVASIGQVVHGHVTGTDGGLPWKDVELQRQQAQQGASHGTVTGPSHYTAAKDRYG